MTEEIPQFDEATSLRLELAGYMNCIRAYWGRLPPNARAVLMDLTRHRRDEIAETRGLFYLAKEVRPFAGGGMHPRMIMALLRAVTGAVEIFSPRKIAEGICAGFVVADQTTLLWSARQGELLFFRSARRETLEQVQEFAGIDGAMSDRWLYGLEVACEGGNTRSNSIEVTPAGAAPIDQTRDAIQAWAADLRIDFLPGDAGQSRLSFEAIVASGDPDRQVTSSTFGGNRPDTNDHAFNAFGLLNTGLAFAPAVSNLVVIRAGASTFPIRAGEPWHRLQVGVDVLAFWKTRANAPIDEPTGPDHFLGWEPDLFLNWRLTSDLSLALRYGVFFPGSAILSGDDARQFFYMGVTYAF